MARAVVNHIGHCVSDLERSRRFYVEVLGFQPWFDFDPPDDPSAKLLGLEAPLGTKAAYLRLGDVVLELLTFVDAGTRHHEPRVMNDRGLTHLSFSVDDIAATCVKVEDYGGTVIADTNIGAAVFIRDPDGQLLELLPATYRKNLPPIPGD